MSRQGARTLVIDDSGHTFETTTAALQYYAHLVHPGGYLVVEDGVVDIEPMRMLPSWPRGVLPAVAAWLKTPAGAEFEIRRDRERYGLSCHPRGFLRRRD